MSNIITDLTNRIEEYRQTNKNPCKSYASQAAAEKATARVAHICAAHFTMQHNTVRPARYVVFFNEAWGRWVGAIDLSELINRPTSTGGFLGIAANHGFYSY